MKAAIIAGCVVLSVLSAAPGAHASPLETYRKPVCETAENYAGCMANKKPQMFATDSIRWDCRHGFSLTGDDTGSINDEQAEFIISIAKTPTYKACKAYSECLQKEKHCYINDRRWRGFHTGWW